MHGYMNVIAEPMTFVKVCKLAKQFEIPDFDVMELDKYKNWTRNTKNQRIISSEYPSVTGLPSATLCLVSENLMEH